MIAGYTLQRVLLGHAVKVRISTKSFVVARLVAFSHDAPSLGYHRHTLAAPCLAQVAQNQQQHT
jgi:hypothetical protein